MKSILENRPELAYEVNQAAEVAGYLWQKGWAERNGGNITLNITEYVDDEIRALPAISEVKQIGKVLPYLKGCYFYCKGTQMRMRDLARWPMANGSIIRILDDCASYVIIADQPVMPTSELPSHLAVHNYLLEKGSPYRASLHTHPIELIAMTHNKKFLEKDVATNLLWNTILFKNFNYFVCDFKTDQVFICHKERFLKTSTHGFHRNCFPTSCSEVRGFVQYHSVHILHSYLGKLKATVISFICS